MSATDDVVVGVWVAAGVFALMGLIGFILGWVAWSKTQPGGSKLFGANNGWLHILGAFLWSPVELILGSIEIHRQNAGK